VCVLPEYAEFMVECRKSKSCKKKKPYIAAPIIPELSLLMANAIRIGILTTPKIIPKPCTILFTSSCLIVYLNFEFA
jgi:hypothetical protein